MMYDKIKRMSIMLFAITVIFLTINAIDAFASDTFSYVSGNIVEDTIWDNTSCVYKLTGSVSIKQGVSLTIGSGVVVDGDNNGITVYGSLNVEGATLSNTSIKIGNNSVNKPASIIIKKSSLSNGDLLSPTGNAAYAHVELRDNKIADTLGYTYIWYPVDTTYITGNIFKNFGGFSIGSNHDVHILDNTFHGHKTGDRALIEDWAQYNNSNCYVRYNKFDYSGTVLSLPTGYSPANIIADHNYWYTNREENIISRIFDYNDDFGSAAQIPYVPIIDENGVEIDIIPVGEPQSPTIDDNFIYIEGQIVNDTSWIDTSRTYKFTGNVSIKQGVRLSIGSGVIVDGDNHEIAVFGSLNVDGAALTNTSINVGSNSSNEPASIIMKNSSFSNGELLSPTGKAAYAHVELRENKITDTFSYTYIWYPEDTTYIVGNTFANFGGFSIGSDNDVYIINNTFKGHNTESRALIENWAQYNNSNCYVRYNRFDYAGLVLSLPSGYSNASIIADHNFWYTNNKEEISARIYDYNDDFGSANEIQFLPIIHMTILPSNLSSIEDEAFAKTDVEYLIVPPSCKYIGKNAFSSCSELLYVEIPKNCIIDAGAFDDCPNTTIIIYE